ncbi:DUF3000 family protein [Bifidobacterium platyrrhinorum]|uniref:DUF3000 family protein n=1 Tax=Bifidobacterium platyrrhinorum TaxID=2661628 RepID=A0A6L9SPQ7_9BIFI|nr:DUF3000 family protein [Bifidobacterium platyrrhinorum]NEG54518.1 DUF3000 family protein [Bifidobacterium platyrrhinorum]
MADIYAFPTGVKSRTGRDADPELPGRPVGVPDDVWQAVESIREMPHLRDVRYREIPVPSTLADYGIGVELESGAREDAADRMFDGTMPTGLATGWIMILYSVEPRSDWGSNWRCVAFARLPLDKGENDALTPDMYWDIMCDHLDAAEPGSIGGTVTVTRNTAFGSLGRDDSAGCEMRVSFTPTTFDGMSYDAGASVSAWARFLRSTIFDGETDVD